jgi:hypothetical protein
MIALNLVSHVVHTRSRSRGGTGPVANENLVSTGTAISPVPERKQLPLTDLIRNSGVLITGLGEANSRNVKYMWSQDLGNFVSQGNPVPVSPISHSSSFGCIDCLKASIAAKWHIQLSSRQHRMTRRTYHPNPSESLATSKSGRISRPSPDGDTLCVDVERSYRDIVDSLVYDSSCGLWVTLRLDNCGGLRGRLGCVFFLTRRA